MSFTDLLAAARALPRDEQLQLANAIIGGAGEGAARSADEELLATMFPPGVVYEVFTPLDSHAAAVAIQELLDAEAAKK